MLLLPVMKQKLTLSYCTKPAHCNLSDSSISILTIAKLAENSITYAKLSLRGKLTKTGYLLPLLLATCYVLR